MISVERIDLQRIYSMGSEHFRLILLFVGVTFNSGNVIWNFKLKLPPDASVVRSANSLIRIPFSLEVSVRDWIQMMGNRLILWDNRNNIFIFVIMPHKCLTVASLIATVLVLHIVFKLLESMCTLQHPARVAHEHKHHFTKQHRHHMPPLGKMFVSRNLLMQAVSVARKIPLLTFHFHWLISRLRTCPTKTTATQ